MHAHETGAGQPLFHFLHAQQYDEGTWHSLEIDAKVFAHALDVAYVVDVDPYHAVLRFQEDGVVVVGRCRLLNGRCGSVKQVVAGLHLVGRPLHVVETEGLEQVVHGIDLEPVDGILGVGSGEDHQRWCCQRLHEVHAIEVGHVDVDEDGIDHLFLHDLAGLEGTLAGFHELQEGYFLDIGGQLAECQRLIVDGKASYHSAVCFYGLSCSFNSNVTS